VLFADDDSASRASRRARITPEPMIAAEITAINKNNSNISDMTSSVRADCKRAAESAWQLFQ
jgi:hypothetical protein